MDLRPNAVGEAVLDHHHGLRGLGHFEHEHVASIDVAPPGPATDCWPQPTRRYRKESLNRPVGVAVAGRFAVVFHSHEEHPPVRVGESGDRFGDLVPDPPPPNLLRWVHTSIPSRLELAELPFPLGERTPNLVLFETYRHDHAPGTEDDRSREVTSPPVHLGDAHGPAGPPHAATTNQVRP